MFAISKDDPVAAGGFPADVLNVASKNVASKNIAGKDESGGCRPEPLASPGRASGGRARPVRDREQSEFQRLLAYALNALARREYSTVELKRKLNIKSGASGASGGEATAKTDQHIDQVIEALLLDGSLSDERFAAEFVRSRIGKGYGPIRIRMDLLERGVPDRLAEEELTRPSEFWQQRAAEVCMRKFGDPAQPESGARVESCADTPGGLDYLSPDALPDALPDVLPDGSPDGSPEEVRDALRDRKDAAQRRWNRCARFLSQRGFPADLIYRTLDGRLLD